MNNNILFLILIKKIGTHNKYLYYCKVTLNFINYIDDTIPPYKTTR